MRHDYTYRLVAAVAGLLLVGAVVFAAIASRSDPAGLDRVAEVMRLDGDTRSGEDLFSRAIEPTCASCHGLAAVSATSEARLDLDAVRPSPQQVARSLVTDAVPAHERHQYRSVLSDRDVADLAAFVEASTSTG